MTKSDLFKAIRLLAGGEWLRVWREFHVRIYRPFYEVIYLLTGWIHRQPRKTSDSGLRVQTDHPIAYESPDHISPSGTKENNSTNKKFVLRMNDIVCREFPGEDKYFMDLGCSGGQLVADFKDMNWIAVGLEGSDYSLKRKRAHWATLANTHLFTCDITKPYRILQNGSPVQFHLITAWEVLEHIAGNDLDAVFRQIIGQLRPGGYFLASTTSTPDVVNGVELHQTQMTHQEWLKFIAARYPEIEPVDLGFKIYQYVRYNFLNPSNLVYRKKKT
jgi:SAM-dependent methyltransferase